MKQDLTTKSGYKNAVVFLKKNPMWFGLSGPIIELAFFAAAKLFSSADQKTNKQIKIAEDLIKTGKEQGVDSMTVKVNNAVGVHLKSSMKEYPLEFILGNSNDMEITVKYK